jgi:hypothetical protein
MTFDQLGHIGEALTIIGVGWAVISKINRLISIFEDFPPHRHVNGTVLYPKGFAPETLDHLPEPPRA